MTRFLPPFLFLAACTLAPVERETVGEVRIGADRYPIEAVAADRWWVKVDGQTVFCSWPNADSCYWSVRHYLNQQAIFSDLD